MKEKDYVNFECIHIADADQNDPDERQALAYAEIDGYPTDDNAQGTVICRVWLMKEKQGIYPTYLVDWHYNGYRENKSVLERIKQAKEDLKKYKDNMVEKVKDNMVEKVFQSAYSKYKLQWMLNHDCTLEELVSDLQKRTENGAVNITEAFTDFENGPGFAGDKMWECQCEFQDTEWEDEEYMGRLLNSEEYAVWLNRKWRGMILYDNCKNKYGQNS